MVGKIFLHIGPPKTATTSLQHALEKITADNVVFGGAFQPRDRNTNSLSQKFYQSCSHVGYSDFSETEALLLELNDLVRSGKSLLLSEEMFLVEQPEASIASKLEIAGRLLSGFSCCIILTLRNPEDALASFYQEIYTGLPLGLKLSFKRFCRDARTLCYDYMYVINKLRDAGFDEIRLLDFQNLTQGPVPLNCVLGDVAEPSVLLDLEVHNAGTKSGTPDSRKLPAITLKSLVHLSFIQSTISKSNLREKAAYRHLANFTHSLVLKQEGFRSLTIPPDTLFHFESSYRQAKQLMAKSHNLNMELR